MGRMPRHTMPLIKILLVILPMQFGSSLAWAGEAEEWFNQGNEFLRNSEYSQAIRAYKEAIQLKLDNTEAYKYLGIAYGKLGRHAEAASAFEEAVRLKPDDYTVHYNLGIAYGALGRSKEAMVALKRAIQLRPDFADAHFYLAVAYGEVGQWGDAVAAYKEAVRLKPVYPIAHYNLGVAHLKLGNTRGAQNEYDWLKTKDPNRAEKLYASIQRRRTVAKKAPQKSGQTQIGDVRSRAGILSRSIEGFTLSMSQEKAIEILRSRLGRDLTKVTLQGYYYGSIVGPIHLPFVSEDTFRRVPLEKSTIFRSPTTNGIQLFFYRKKLVTIKMSPHASNEVLIAEMARKYGQPTEEDSLLYAIWEDNNTRISIISPMGEGFLHKDHKDIFSRSFHVPKGDPSYPLAKSYYFELVYTDKQLDQAIKSRANELQRIEKEQRERKRRTLPKGF